MQSFLVLKLHLNEPSPRLGRLMELNHDLRRARGIFMETQPARLSFRPGLRPLPVAALLRDVAR